jgi:hypothetical protein
MKNKYVQRSRISEKKFKELLKYFALDLQANQIAQLTGISRNSVNSYTKAIRLTMLKATTSASSQAQLQYGTTLLFGVSSPQHRIVVEPLPTLLNNDIYKLLREKDIAGINEIIPAPYGGLIDFTSKRFIHLQHPYQSQASNLEISAFWGYTKSRLVKFRGISTQNIYLHLKECEFRYNHRNIDLYRYLLNFFRKHPLQL